MTQHASPQSVRGNFTNLTLHALGEEYHLSRRRDGFFVEMPDPEWKYRQLMAEKAYRNGGPPPPARTIPRVEKRITLTTGSHHMQKYWVAGENGNLQFSVPFTYLFEDQRWVPRNDVFMLPPDAPLSIQLWNDNCLGCHSTAGQPGFHQTTAGPESRVAELGISCESCHGPGETHTRANSNPLRRYALHKKPDSDPTITNPARLSKKKASEICGQCHAARFSLNHGEWLMNGTDYWHRENLDAHRPLLPGQRLREPINPNDPEQAEHRQALGHYFWGDGMIRVSGREFNGLVETPCYQRGKMSCLSCHSMHKSDPKDQLARGMEGNAACYQCHSDYANKLTQHTRHAADSSGSLCYNCHMPHTTYGLLKGIRSHQITSPSVQNNLETGRPNACNLCHLDRTLAWTADKLNQWYKRGNPGLDSDLQSAPAAAIWLMRGDAGQRALIAWHMGWEPARAASGTNWLVPYLAETLDDPYAVVRYIGHRALKTIPGSNASDYDYIGPPSQRLLHKSQLLQRWNTANLQEAERSRVLPPKELSRLLEQRDHRRMELLE